jgi:hypothetical protein
LFAIGGPRLSESLRGRLVQDEARRALAMQPIQLDEEAIELLEATAGAPALELLGTLAAERRRAIEARYLEQRGYAEIAGDLRCAKASSASTRAVTWPGSAPSWERNRRHERSHRRSEARVSRRRRAPAQRRRGA